MGPLGLGDMLSLRDSFLCSVIGPDGLDAVSELVSDCPQYEPIVLPRLVFAWLSRLSAKEFIGSLPGIPDSSARIRTKVDLFSGRIVFEKNFVRFSSVDIETLTGIVSVMLEPRSNFGGLQLGTAEAQALGQNLDLLVNYYFLSPGAIKAPKATKFRRKKKRIPRFVVRNPNAVCFKCENPFFDKYFSFVGCSCFKFLAASVDVLPIKGGVELAFNYPWTIDQFSAFLDCINP